MRPTITASVLLFMHLFLVACAQTFNYQRGTSLTGGDPQAGKEQIVMHDCHSCHEIPGIPVNRYRRGPSLKHWAKQNTIAKKWPNTPENLEHFLQDPERMLHGSGLRNEMTMSSVKAGDARNMAAYLFSID